MAVTGGRGALAGAASEGRPGAGGTVVITGADGFIGSACCAHAAAAGRPLRALVHSLRRRAPLPVITNERAAPTAAGTTALDLETAGHAELVEALAGARAVVHLAGRAHRMGRVSDEAAEAAMHGPNVEATAWLARAAVDAGVARFVFASTLKVNGEVTLPGRPFRADDAPAPEDAYARSKLAAEAALVEAAAGTAMLPVILRLPMVYGPGARGNFRRLVEAVARGRWLPVGGIDNRRSLLSLDNLVAALDAALDAAATAMPGTAHGEASGSGAGHGVASQVHLLTDADSISTPQLVRAIARALGVKARLVPVPVTLLRWAGAATGRTAEIARLTRSLEADSSSFTSWTGWRPRPFAIDRAMLAADFPHELSRECPRDVAQGGGR